MDYILQQGMGQYVQGINVILFTMTFCSVGFRHRAQGMNSSSFSGSWENTRDIFLFLKNLNTIIYYITHILKKYM
jgi:hypothetical protein